MKFFQNTSKIISALVLFGVLSLIPLFSSTVSAQIPPMPDYIVDTIIPVPNPVRVGESPLQFTATVRNIGNAPGGTTTQTKLYINKTGPLINEYEDFKITGNLQGSGSENEIWNLNPNLPLDWYPRSGTHTITVCADPDQLIPEVDESNNCTTTDFTIDPVDYIISSPISISPANPTVGSVVTFSWTVKNQGTGDSGTESHTRLKIDWGNNGTWDYTFGNLTIGAVPEHVSGGTYVQTFSPGAGQTLPSGNHKINICADAPLATPGVNYADNLPDIMESNEGNNCQNFMIVSGCTDNTATNYNAGAIVDDGSCVYPPILGCMDINSPDYDSLATQDDGSCTYPPVPVPGCMDNTATNYAASATVDDGTCNYAPTQCVNTPARVSGFAWSDMPDGSDECIVGQNAPCLSGGNSSNLSSGRGAGWISMSGQAQDGTAYTVSVDNQGNFSGYAWSNPSDDVANPPTSNIGWIDFNPDGPFPSGSGTTASPAKIDMQLDGNGNITGSGQWSGWIRVTAPMNDPNAGGWDGWISLRGNGYGVQTNLVTGVTTGHAWGDAVMGWVDFGKTIVTPPTACIDNPPPPPTGCTDPLATNYSPSAVEDDGSCEYDNPVEVCNGTDDDNDGQVDEGLDCENNPQSCVVPSLNATAGTCQVSWSAQNFAGASCAVVSSTGVSVATGGLSDQKTVPSNGSYTVQCTKNGLRVSETVSISGCK